VIDSAVRGPAHRPQHLAARMAVALVMVLGACSAGGAKADRLPALELPTLDGSGLVALDQLEGPSVINLWATWCAPCRRELPDFERVHLELGDEVRFIGVNIGDRADEASRFIESVGVTFDQLLDLDGALNTALGTATLPVTVVTNSDGTISLVHTGPMDASELRAAIAMAT